MIGRRSVLLIGLGNLLHRDDAVGVRAIDAFSRRFTAPPEVRVWEGHGVGRAIFPLLDEARGVIFVGSILGNEPPGTLIRLDGIPVLRLAADDLFPDDEDEAIRLEAHLQSIPARDLIFWGISVADVSVGLGVSAAVGDAIPLLVERMAAEVARYGLPVIGRKVDASEVVDAVPADDTLVDA